MSPSARCKNFGLQKIKILIESDMKNGLKKSALVVVVLLSALWCRAQQPGINPPLPPPAAMNRAPSNPPPPGVRPAGLTQLVKLFNRDHEKIRLLLKNLLINAIKYSRQRCHMAIWGRSRFCGRYLSFFNSSGRRTQPCISIS